MIGGGPDGIAQAIEEETKINTVAVEEPAQAVIRGCGELLEEPEVLRRIKRRIR